MTYRTITAFRRDPSGLLERIDLLHDGASPCDPFGYPLEETAEVEMLKGWGPHDGPARIYKTWGGLEILVPQQGFMSSVDTSSPTDEAIRRAPRNEYGEAVIFLSQTEGALHRHARARIRHYGSYLFRWFGDTGRGGSSVLVRVIAD